MQSNDKGDVGVAKVISDLTNKGIKISLPLSHHLPFDIIAISDDYKLSRLSVKFSDNPNNLKVEFRTISATSKNVVRRVNWNHVDAFAVYSPVTDKCYYFYKSQLMGYKARMTVRFKPSELRDYKIASDFLDENVIFGV